MLGQIDDGDLASEPGKGLRELASDGTRADHEQAGRQRREGEDRLVGQVTGSTEAGNLWHVGSPAGGDHRPAELESLSPDLDRRESHEPAVTEKYIYAELTESVDAVDGTQVGPDPPHALHHRSEISALHGRRSSEEPVCLPCFMPSWRSPDDRFRRNAADVEAIAPHETALDQRDSGTKPRSCRRCHESSGAGADHHEMVPVLRIGVQPAGRVHVLQQPSVVLVGRVEHQEPPSRTASRSARRAARVTSAVTTIVATTPIPSRR